MSMRQSRGIHWRAPVTMATAFLAGLLVAIGHHIFYRSLNMKSVEETRYDQQMNIRIGTAFSFVVRACLVVAVGVAYWQIFWMVLLGNRLRVSTIDSMADLLGNMTSFFDVSALRVSPALVGAALISWLIPLAVVVPPATLTVVSTTIVTSHMTNMPTINFATGPMATITQIGENEQFMYISNYSGPTQMLSRVALSTAFQGQLPNLPSPGPNSSYTLDFDGPRVQCKTIPTDILDNFRSSSSCANFAAGIDCVFQLITYVAWAPSSNMLVPLGNGSMQLQAMPMISDPTQPNYSYLGAFDGGPATLFFATTQDSNQRRTSWQVLNCSLWNSTYSTRFSFTNGRQDVTILQTQDNHSVGYQRNISSRSVFGVDQNLNYQALMDCLGRMLVGSIGSDFDVASTFLESGDALQTDIAYSREMFPTFNATIAETPAYNTTILSAILSPNFNRSATALIEEMFQNMTIALFSNQAFLDQGSLRANVTVSTDKNIYQYSQLHLLLAYGLSVVLALIIVALGLWTVWASQGSYSNKFSTVMRTTAGSSLTVMVYNLDRTGADPLDKELGKLKVQLGDGGSVDEVRPSGQSEMKRPQRSTETEFMTEASSMLESRRSDTRR